MKSKLNLILYTGKGMLMILWMMFIFAGCMVKSEYERIKESELASGKVYNDLFLDIYFGMSRKEFYGTCWEHNKNGILTNGAHHLQIQYKPKSPSGKEILMYFYPKFEEDKLFYMPIEFQYAVRLPSLEEYSNKYLMEDVLLILEEMFGEGFFEVNNKQNSVSALVKINGNRHIRVFKKNLSTIRVEILDVNVMDFTTMMGNDK